MSKACDELLRDACRVLLDAGIARDEIVGLMLQIRFAVDGMTVERAAGICFQEMEAREVHT